MSYMSKSHRPGTGYAGIILSLAVLIAAIAYSATRIWPMFASSNAKPRMVTPRGELADTEKTTIDIFESTSPSVVYVTNADYTRNPFTGQVSLQPQGTGSGFVWDEFGHIVTNYHVIEGTGQHIVTLADQRSLDAVVVGFSKRHDLAVLQVQVLAGELKPTPIGTSKSLRVGQSVYAIGNPFGLDQTLTTGVISALHRDIQQHEGGEVLRDMIQTDAAINPGNSGGPLIDSAGLLIGVNTAIYTPNETISNVGIGFAVPVDVVNDIVPQLIAHGRVVKPWIGVALRTTSTLNLTNINGLVITSIYRNSPADKAGLRGITIYHGRSILGDVILAIDDQPVPTLDAFSKVMEKYKGGETISLRIYREGKEIIVEVTLELVAVDG